MIEQCNHAQSSNPRKTAEKIIMIGQCNHAQSSNARKTAEIVIMIRWCNHAKPSIPSITAEKNYHDSAVQSCTIVKSKKNSRNSYHDKTV